MTADISTHVVIRPASDASPYRLGRSLRFRSTIPTLPPFFRGDPFFLTTGSFLLAVKDTVTFGVLFFPQGTPPLDPTPHLDADPDTRLYDLGPLTLLHDKGWRGGRFVVNTILAGAHITAFSQRNPWADFLFSPRRVPGVFRTVALADQIHHSLWSRLT